MNVAFQKGWVDWIPDWAAALLFIIPVLLWIYWLWTHEGVRKRRYLIYTYRRMSLAILIVGGAIIGGSIGALLWWSIYRQPTAVAQSAPQPTPEEVRPSSANVTPPVAPSPSSTIPSLTPSAMTSPQSSLTPQPTPSAQTSASSETQNQSLENSLTDFKVTRETDREVNAEVWYFYTGDLGMEDIIVSIVPYTQSGDYAHVMGDSTRVLVAKRKAIAQLKMEYTPPQPGVVEKTTQVEICIGINKAPDYSPLYCRRFSYEKVWK